MNRSILYCLRLSLLAVVWAAGAPAHAMTLFKCIRAGHVTYLDTEPGPGQCDTQTKTDIDPDANVVPAPEPAPAAQETGGQVSSGDASSRASAGRVEGVSEDDAGLISSEDGDLVNTPEPVTPGAPVSSGAPVAPGAVVSPGGVVGP